jgi:hypothetical protein
MFGHAFFGIGFFGPAYWGPAVAAAGFLPAFAMNVNAVIQRVKVDP